jgi:hypothetical protein
MAFPSIHLSPSGRSVLSFVISAMLLCPAASPQGMPNTAKATNSAKSVRHQGVENNNFLKAGLAFTPPPWPPIDVDAAVVTVNSQVPCPLSSVLQGASQHAVEFAANLDLFTATEVIQSADARKNGGWNHLQTRAFNYMAIVTRPRAGVVYVDESREANAKSTSPPVRTEGLAVTALIFHPHTINNFAMVCEGMGEWHGKSAWMVHFAQRAGIPTNFQAIRINDRFFGVKLKGRAWIAADNYEIEHVDIDLLERIPQIRLLTEHSSIDYGSVGFTKGNLHLWLPQMVDFYLDVGGRHYFNHHRLSNFLLFSVDTKQETQEPRLPE